MAETEPTSVAPEGQLSEPVVETPAVAPALTLGEHADNAAKAEVEGAGKKVEPGAGEPEAKVEGEAPKERVYSKGEFEKAQSAHDKLVDAATKRAEQAEKAATAAADKMAQLVEEGEKQRFDKLIKSIEEQGGDASTAKLLADSAKEARTMAREAAATKAQAEAEQAKVNAGLKIITADKLAKQFELDAESLGKLMEIDDPNKMENAALTIALQKAKEGQKPVTKPGAGQREAISNAEAVSGTQKLGEAMEEAARRRG